VTYLGCLLLLGVCLHECAPHPPGAAHLAHHHSSHGANHNPAAANYPPPPLAGNYRVDSVHRGYPYKHNANHNHRHVVDSDALEASAVIARSVNEVRWKLKEHGKKFDGKSVTSIHTSYL